MLSSAIWLTLIPVLCVAFIFTMSTLLALATANLLLWVVFWSLAQFFGERKLEYLSANEIFDGCKT